MTGVPSFWKKTPPLAATRKEGRRFASKPNAPPGQEKPMDPPALSFPTEVDGVVLRVVPGLWNRGWKSKWKHDVVYVKEGETWIPIGRTQSRWRHFGQSGRRLDTMTMSDVSSAAVSGQNYQWLLREYNARLAAARNES